MTNLAQRIATSLVGIPVVIGLTFLGGWYFVGLVAFVGALGQYEFYRLHGDLMDSRHIGVGIVSGVLLVLFQYDMPAMGVLALLLIVALLIVDAFDTKDDRIWARDAWMIAGLLYPALVFSFLVRLRTEWGGLLTDLEHFFLPVSMLVVVWATDTLAYFVGRSIGKHPLAPNISPHKTWEGAIGGLGGALLAMILMKLSVLSFLSWVDIVALALIGGVVSQLGDLTQSRLKRIFSVKDSGTFLPGHGGILDRVDGLLLVVPVYYVYLTLALG